MRGTARSRRARHLRNRQPRACCGPAPPQPDRGRPPLVARHSGSRGPRPLPRHQARSPSRPRGSPIPCGCTGRVARQGVPYGSATGPGGVIRPRLPQATRPPPRRAPALAIAGQTRPRISAPPDLPPSAASTRAAVLDRQGSRPHRPCGACLPTRRQRASRSWKGRVPLSVPVNRDLPPTQRQRASRSGPACAARLSRPLGTSPRRVIFANPGRRPHFIPRDLTPDRTSERASWGHGQAVRPSGPKAPPKRHLCGAQPDRAVSCSVRGNHLTVSLIAPQPTQPGSVEFAERVPVGQGSVPHPSRPDGICPPRGVASIRHRAGRTARPSRLHRTRPRRCAVANPAILPICLSLPHGTRPDTASTRVRTAGDTRPNAVLPRPQHAHRSWQIGSAVLPG